MKLLRAPATHKDTNHSSLVWTSFSKDDEYLRKVFKGDQGWKNDLLLGKVKSTPHYHYKIAFTVNETNMDHTLMSGEMMTPFMRKFYSNMLFSRKYGKPRIKP